MDKEEAKKNKLKKLVEFTRKPDIASFAESIDTTQAIKDVAKNTSEASDKIAEAIFELKPTLEKSTKAIDFIDGFLEVLKAEYSLKEDQIKKIAEAIAQNLPEPVINLEVDEDKIADLVLSKIKIPDPIPGKQGKPGKPADEAKIVEKVLSKLPKLNPLDESALVEKILKLLPILPEVLTFEEIIKQINSKERIIDWKTLKNVPYDVTHKSTSKGGMRGGGDTIFYSDLSSQCDGVTMTFTVPRHNKIVGLRGTQFPIIYRPSVDFTTSGTTLTLTSQVGAVESGQTLIFEYV